MENQKKYDVTALGELLIDFTPAGTSAQGSPILEQNPGGAPCNVLAMLARYKRTTGFIGKIGNDIHGRFLSKAVRDAGISSQGLVMSDEVHTTLAFVSIDGAGDRNFSFYRNPGADMALTEDEVDLDMIRSSRIFHFGTLSMTHEAVRKATKRAIACAKAVSYTHLHVHLDGIEPALLQPHGSLDLQALLLVDLLDRQAARGLAPRLGNRHLVLGQRRGRDRGKPVRGRAGRRADMMQLTDGEAPVLVNGLVELDHAGNEPVVVSAQVDASRRFPQYGLSLIHI